MKNKTKNKKWQYFIAADNRTLYRYDGKKFQWKHNSLKWVASISYAEDHYDPYKLVSEFRPLDDNELFLYLL